MDTLTNPQLQYMCVVVLKDGRRGNIVDKSVKLRTRRIDFIGDRLIPTERINVSKIQKAFCHGIWYKCDWD